MPNDKIAAVGANIAEKAAMIWNVADMLRGPFKPHEYGLVILPMTVVKRFHDCLLPTHQAVLDTYEKVKKLQVIDGFLQKASGYQFYNTSRFTFETLLADPDNMSPTSGIICPASPPTRRTCWQSSTLTTSSSGWWRATPSTSLSRSSAPKRVILAGQDQRRRLRLHLRGSGAAVL